ncbi:hypothetical protein E2C01_090743 [Portunus trituberculatus]|uniref:Uncharacterized protein n=1 Tax=Portunus trituberculatus TaxID=210409 RepID=A0A5B7JMK2_PORTR|nr:hypothetical protein [Portunus trituberculatus]
MHYLGPEGDIGVEVFIILLDSVLPAILATLLERGQPVDTTPALAPTSTTTITILPSHHTKTNVLKHFHAAPSLFPKVSS